MTRAILISIGVGHNAVARWGFTHHWFADWTQHVAAIILHLWQGWGFQLARAGDGRAVILWHCEVLALYRYRLNRSRLIVALVRYRISTSNNYQAIATGFHIFCANSEIRTAVVADGQTCCSKFCYRCVRFRCGGRITTLYGQIRQRSLNCWTIIILNPSISNGHLFCLIATYINRCRCPGLATFAVIFLYRTCGNLQFAGYIGITIICNTEFRCLDFWIAAEVFVVLRCRSDDWFFILPNFKLFRLTITNICTIYINICANFVSVSCLQFFIKSRLPNSFIHTKILMFFVGYRLTSSLGNA